MVDLELFALVQDNRNNREEAVQAKLHEVDKRHIRVCNCLEAKERRREVVENRLLKEDKALLEGR